jgi:hypothetical protein
MLIPIAMGKSRGGFYKIAEHGLKIVLCKLWVVVARN